MSAMENWCERQATEDLIDKLSTQIEDNKETAAVAGKEEVTSVCVYLI